MESNTEHTCNWSLAQVAPLGRRQGSGAVVPFTFTVKAPGVAGRGLVRGPPLSIKESQTLAE